MANPVTSASTSDAISSHALAAHRSAAAASETSTVFPLATRASGLALCQTRLVSDVFKRIHPAEQYAFPVTPMSVLGDRNKQAPLYLLSDTASGATANMPAKSLWTEELEVALLAREVDMIVHSMKDVPTQLPDGCEIGAILEREDPRDALIVKQGLPYRSLAELPDGSVVGTSSVRRIAQLKRTYPGLKVQDVRGNLDTRFRKLDDPEGPYTALILAAAGVNRMSLSSRITSLLSSAEEAGGMYHAVGQGAIAIEVRQRDARVQAILAGAGDWRTEWAVGAERALLAELEGGCSVPVGVESSVEELSAEAAAAHCGQAAPDLPADAPFIHRSGAGKHAALTLHVCVTSLDGQHQAVHRAERSVISRYAAAEAWGRRVAREVASMGAGEILDEVNKLRKQRAEAGLQPNGAERPSGQFTRKETLGHEITDGSLGR